MQILIFVQTKNLHIDLAIPFKAVNNHWPKTLKQVFLIPLSGWKFSHLLPQYACMTKTQKILITLFLGRLFNGNGRSI